MGDVSGEAVKLIPALVFILRSSSVTNNIGEGIVEQIIFTKTLIIFCSEDSTRLDFCAELSQENV